MSRIFLALVALTTVYALTLASFAPWDLALGLAISALVLSSLRGFLLGEELQPIEGLARRLLALPALLAHVLVDITVGTWRVASVVLGFRPLAQPGIVDIPLGERTETGAVVSAFLSTLSPGEYLVDIDWARRCLLMHVIDARDPEAVRARFADFYERHQRKVVP
ncbi:MAG: Na+/H+ antiporter subunit E [Thermoleophilia bacterium]|nr:Na+/H+ antiporter subunit E [Gaiellaceae bacterium]MDW8339016.1 Na+/H+ antiporter subunit E [Thermoleophilia bacterium]